MGVYLQGENWATQGPAPSGFHVPLTTERQAVKDIRIALGGGSSDGTNFGIALKLPFAGTRSGTDANVYSQGSHGRYWSSSRYSTSSAYNLYFNSSAILPQYTLTRSNGLSVRCFKDIPVVPTSSWTKLYGTSIETGGIFWSNTDGLISLSSDGQTWITISDKNLGATAVWNSGDTLSQSNCGYYYQRGNNYGFAWTGSVTTSSTQVNASAYGPGNYYSSSTFITRSSSPYDWSSVQNDNLWGGEDGNVPTVSELKNAYIGEYRVPGANTVAYYPLTSTTTVNDISGNNRNLTQVDNSTFGTYLGVNCVYVYGNSQSGFHCLYNRNVNNQTLGNKFTVSFWGSRLNQNTNSIICGMGGTNGKWNGYNIYGNSSNVENEILNNGSINKITYSKTISVGEWHLYTAVYDNGNSKLYVDGVLGASGNYTVGTINVIGVGISFGTQTTGYTYQGNGYLSNYILENKARTAQEVQDYCNLTKSDYGL